MQPLPATVESRKFGKYTLVAKLAQGGMAEIFLARLGGAAGFEKLVCIKRILPSYLEDAEFVSMFLGEARIAARISHPNVCQVFELGSLEGQYYIAMEYLAGVPVSMFRRRDKYVMPPDPRLVIGIAAQACEGLHHAHQLKGPDGHPLGVVHRDITTQNLFVTADGIVKVLDFGIAKIQSASQKTTTGTVKGTYAYMPPEQLRAEGVDRRSDVFAMGAVVWELLARRHLFQRETDFLTFQAICTDPIPDVCTFRPDIPPEIGAVIARALARERDERWPTARAFGEALQQACLSIGGPLTSAALGEEVVRAFGSTLEEQRTMLEIARAGGEFDLEEPSASLSMGDLVSPVTSLKRRSEALRIPTPPPSAMMSVVVPPRLTTQRPIALAPSRTGLLVALLLLAAAAGAGAVYYFLVHNQPSPRPAAVAAQHGEAPSAKPGSSAEPAAVAIDAAIAVAEIDAGSAGPGHPAVVEPPREAVVIKEPPSPPRPTRPAIAKPPPAPRPPPPVPAVSGPPGSITIDSAPVYAVIFIDGKRYGETPLVDVKLPPGRHSVRAVSPSGGTQNLSITIEAGKRARGRRIEW